MSSEDENLQKLERVLSEAHQVRHVPILKPGWAERVMRDVRAVDTLANPHIYVERLVWQTAAFAAAVALIVTVSIVAWSQAPLHEGMGLLTEEFESTPLFFE